MRIRATSESVNRWAILAGCVAATAAALLGGCAENGWAKGFAPASEGIAYAPIQHATLQYVDDFESLGPQMQTSGAVTIGYSNFTGVFTDDSEDDLREFASSIGADHVLWGLKFLHQERQTSLQPVSETYTTRRTGRAFNPETGRFDGPRRAIDETTYGTTYVPVVEDHAYYIFRAVFLRADGN